MAEALKPQPRRFVLRTGTVSRLLKHLSMLCKTLGQLVRQPASWLDLSLAICSRPTASGLAAHAIALYLSSARQRFCRLLCCIV